jgi:hypothetical protein
VGPSDMLAARNGSVDRSGGAEFTAQLPCVTGYLASARRRKRFRVAAKDRWIITSYRPVGSDFMAMPASATIR